MAPNRAKPPRKAPHKPGKMAAVATKAKAGSLPDREQVEKDETEESLEKLVFGDEAGFLDALKPDNTSQKLLRNSTQSDGEEQGPSENSEDLEDVADEDVGSALTLRKSLHLC